MSEGIDPSELERDLSERVTGSLANGERLLWLGQPRPGRQALRALPILLFAIPWTAFAVFWECGALWGTHQARDHGGIGMAVGIIFPLFGLPFVLIGLGMLSAPWWAARRARRTVYGVTSQRAFILDGGFLRELRSYPAAALSAASCSERPDGWGEVALMPPPDLVQRGGRTYQPGNRATFEDVRDPRRVLALTQSLLAGPN
jgi:hypothetical protein